jgi:predicted AAA+ superfamily ATPase
MKTLSRTSNVKTAERYLRENPVVAVLGARQVGKTTLARQLVSRRKGESHFFDLEQPQDLARLDEPMLALEPLRGLVVLDEVQNRPDVFPILRTLADRPQKTARFLVLGSASPELLRQSSETLAGRIAFHHLSGLDLEETGPGALGRLWFRGGFPRSYLARSHRESSEWRRDFIRTFVERDLPQLGVRIPGGTMGRFWAMLAHYHGQVLNASEIGRSLGASHTTIRSYLDLLTNTFMVRQLRPWLQNVGKRIVKSPKLYISDSGILHQLLGLATPVDLERHPKLGASWEGFMLGQVIRRLRAWDEECFFWATQAGAELDLLVVHGRRRLGFEFKRTDSPRVTASIRSAIETLDLSSLTVVHAGPESFPLRRDVRAVAAARLLDDLKPLRR